MSWTDERVEALRKLWLEGWSASKIARELGSGITRNAVIGKVHRLGLSGRPKTASGTPSAPRPREKEKTRTQERVNYASRGGSDRGASIPQSVGNTALAINLAPIRALMPKLDLRPETEVVIPICERVTIMELRESMCRWPLGDPLQPEFRYCGSRTPPSEGPYCSAHARMAYQPASERRKTATSEKKIIR